MWHVLGSRRRTITGLRTQGVGVLHGALRWGSDACAAKWIYAPDVWRCAKNREEK